MKIPKAENTSIINDKMTNISEEPRKPNLWKLNIESTKPLLNDYSSDSKNTIRTEMK